MINTQIAAEITGDHHKVLGLAALVKPTLYEEIGKSKTITMLNCRQIDTICSIGYIMDYTNSKNTLDKT